MLLLLPSPRRGEGLGVRGGTFWYWKCLPLPPDPSPWRGEGSKSVSGASEGATSMGVVAYIGLGSNLGNRQDYLDKAIEAIQEHSNMAVRQVSSYYETEPEGGPPGQPLFVNAVAEIETDLDP